MSQIEQLKDMNEQLTHCIGAIKRIEIVLIGDEFNKNGIVQVQEKMQIELKEIKQYQIQQKTGISLGKWILGTSIGAFLLSQLNGLQFFIKNTIK